MGGDTCVGGLHTHTRTHSGGGHSPGFPVCLPGALQAVPLARQPPTEHPTHSVFATQ